VNNVNNDNELEVAWLIKIACDLLDSYDFYDLLLRSL
jgi:hypothetical protein